MYASGFRHMPNNSSYYHDLKLLPTLQVKRDICSNVILYLNYFVSEL